MTATSMNCSSSLLFIGDFGSWNSEDPLHNKRNPCIGVAHLNEQSRTLSREGFVGETQKKRPPPFVLGSRHKFCCAKQGFVCLVVVASPSSNSTLIYPFFLP